MRLAVQGRAPEAAAEAVGLRRGAGGHQLPAAAAAQQHPQRRPGLAAVQRGSRSPRLRLRCSAAPLQQEGRSNFGSLGDDLTPPPQQAAPGSGGNGSNVAAAEAPPGSVAHVAVSSSGISGKAPEADVLIEFRDVYKSFGSKHILRGASFKIRRGEAVGIIGSSGTGKSTTLRLAAGLLQPDKGEVLIKGEPRQGLISDDDTSDKLKVGLVFQSGALFDSLTVGENVGFMLREHTNLPPAKIKELVAESLAKVGLSGVEALYPSELSGGMKKRVALARAIVRDEKHDNVEQVIMYDEPTAGLDPVASTVVEDLIRELHEKHGEGQHHHHGHHHHEHEHSHHHAHTHAHHHHNSGYHAGNGAGGSGSVAVQLEAPLPPPPPGGITSYIVVTHQHSTIRRAVDRIIFLHQGRVVWEGTVEEFDTTDEPIVRQFASGSLEGPIKYE